MDMSVFCLFFSGVYAAAHDFKTEWVVVIRASKTLQMKHSLQVRNGNKLPV